MLHSRRLLLWAVALALLAAGAHAALPAVPAGLTLTGGATQLRVQFTCLAGWDTLDITSYRYNLDRTDVTPTVRVLSPGVVLKSAVSYDAVNSKCTFFIAQAAISAASSANSAGKFSAQLVRVA